MYRKILSVFFVLLLLSGCEGESSVKGRSNVPESPTSSAIKILPLGDSITQGGEGFVSYRRDLWFLLQGAGLNVDFVGGQDNFQGDVADDLKDFDLDHEGHWAWEAGELDDKLEGWLAGYTPDIVMLHAGTNDFDRGQTNESTMQEFENIIAKLRANNLNVVILIAKIIPMKNKDTSSFNRSIEALVKAKNTLESPIVIVDQYNDYEPLTDNHDNYHPNRDGEQKIASKWFEALGPYLVEYN